MGWIRKCGSFPADLCRSFAESMTHGSGFRERPPLSADWRAGFAERSADFDRLFAGEVCGIRFTS
jgi:hypothetical protein